MEPLLFSSLILYTPSQTVEEASKRHAIQIGKQESLEAR